MEVPVLDALPVALHADAVGCDLRDVDTGLERAPVAGVHDHPHIGISVELEPGVGELVAHAGVHGIELVGTIVDEPPDGPAALDDQVLVVAHCGSLFSAHAAGPSVWSGWPHIATSSAAPARHASVR